MMFCPEHSSSFMYLFKG